MGRLSILVALVSGLLGLALAGLAPQRWGITPVHGLLLGLALYAAALRGQVERAIAGMTSGTAWLALAARAAIFLALWWTQAVLCFDVIPDSDVRRGFITLSAWVLAQALLGGSARREELRAKS
ncbi:MAG TPA: hypothetical protein VFX78_02640 [Candidatus Eisenbacteria bacterium]|jgi:hypothetical protein|nr:hypothetical protein [Candidatus Eisenbacteria bacterium]